MLDLTKLLKNGAHDALPFDVERILADWHLAAAVPVAGVAEVSLLSV
jgi:hypothetical protein